jgi:hypothetical protein
LGCWRTAILVATTAAGLVACIHAPKPAPLALAAAPTCLTGDQHPTAELVFARVSNSEPGPGVSEADFARFINLEVTPRFSEGLTVVDAQNLSPKPAGDDIYGPSKVVMIVLPGKADDGARIDAIRNAYTTEFNQQTALEMSKQDCVSY